MSRSTLRPFVLVALLASATAATALAAPEVAITDPLPGQPLFGMVKVEIVVESKQPIKWVDVFLDGLKVGRLAKPPWRTTVDFGQANVEHTLRAVAEDFFGGRGSAEVEAPRIAVNDEVDVELQQLFVSVTDRQGHRMQGLPASDFTIYDDHGNPEPMATFFGGGDLPLSSVLLVDSSASMKGERLQAALAGVQAFVDQTSGEDETMVAFFSDRLLRVTAFTGADAPKLDLQDIHAAGGTAVNDHLYFALNRLQPRLGRRVVVLLSDGLDVSSTLDMQEVLWRLRRSQAMLYWIRLDAGEAGGKAGFITSWRDAAGSLEQVKLLEQAVAESGGRILPIRNLGAAHAGLPGGHRRAPPAVRARLPSAAPAPRRQVAHDLGQGGRSGPVGARPRGVRRRLSRAPCEAAAPGRGACAHPASGRGCGPGPCGPGWRV